MTISLMGAIPPDSACANELLSTLERQRRWRLILGGDAADGLGCAPSATDLGMDRCLQHLLLRQDALQRFGLQHPLPEPEMLELLGRATSLLASGVHLIVLLVLSDQSEPAYDHGIVSPLAGMGAPVFACTPDQFPDLMVAAIERHDLAPWAAARGIVMAGRTPPRRV